MTKPRAVLANPRQSVFSPRLHPAQYEGILREQHGRCAIRGCSGEVFLDDNGQTRPLTYYCSVENGRQIARGLICTRHATIIMWMDGSVEDAANILAFLSARPVERAQRHTAIADVHATP